MNVTMKTRIRIASWLAVMTFASLSLTACFDTAGPLEAETSASASSTEQPEQTEHENQTMEPWVAESIVSKYNVTFESDYISVATEDENGQERKYTLVDVTLKDGTNATYALSTNSETKEATLYIPEDGLIEYKPLLKSPPIKSIER